jgi:Lrp/AsnC family transcriptional regulator, leucine-responsive regulatory protein
MDNIDRDIIRLLNKNSRRSASEIGKELHMSVPAIIERIRKLEDGGVIVKYSLCIDYTKFDKNIMAYIFMGFDSSKLEKDIREYILNNEEIIECSFITGDYDYILKVMTKDPSSLTKLIHKLKSFKKVSRTRTIVILENIKNEAGAVLEKEEIL